MVGTAETAPAEDAEATTGQAYDEEYCLWSNGTLWVDVEVPSTGNYTVSAQVRGTDCGDGVGAVTVELVWEPAWSPDRMSEDAKLALDLGF